MKLSLTEVTPRHPSIKKELVAGPVSLLVKKYQTLYGIQVWYETEETISEDVKTKRTLLLGPEYIVTQEPSFDMAEIVIKAVRRNIEDYEYAGSVPQSKPLEEILLGVARRINRATVSNWNGDSPRIFLDMEAVKNAVAKHPIKKTEKKTEPQQAEESSQSC